MNPATEESTATQARVRTTPTPHSVTHDVRNLLCVVAANVDWLRTAAGDGTDPREILDALVDLEGCAARVRKLLTDAAAQAAVHAAFEKTGSSRNGLF